MRRLHRDPPKMRHIIRKIYLAGPMAQVSHQCSVGWRNKATNALRSMEIEVEDPNDRVNLPFDVLVEGDKQAIKKSQCVLAYAPQGVPFVGTSMEIFFASQVLRIPVVTWGEGNGTNPSSWIAMHSTHVCETLEEALQFIACHTLKESICESVKKIKSRNIRGTPLLKS